MRSEVWKRSVSHHPSLQINEHGRGIQFNHPDSITITFHKSSVHLNKRNNSRSNRSQNTTLGTQRNSSTRISRCAGLRARRLLLAVSGSGLISSLRLRRSARRRSSRGSSLLSVRRSWRSGSSGRGVRLADCGLRDVGYALAAADAVGEQEGFWKGEESLLVGWSSLKVVDYWDMYGISRGRGRRRRTLLVSGIALLCDAAGDVTHERARCANALDVDAAFSGEGVAGAFLLHSNIVVSIGASGIEK